MRKQLHTTLLLLIVAISFAAAQSDRQNLIQLENAKPGTRDWLLTRTRVNPESLWRCRWIEGYCSQMSVQAGETLKIMVSTNPVSEFSLEIFRTGYYGGRGGRLMKSYESLQGRIQPEPAIGENRLRECHWEPSVELEIPDDWLSGVYLGKLTEKQTGVQSYVIFVVRDDRPCDLLYQTNELAWHGYNSWPDDRWSVYHNDENEYGGPNGRKKWTVGADGGSVSFDRPYASFCEPHNSNNPAAQGSGEFLLWEFPLSYWLEQHGYDVSYIANIDTHRDGKGLLRSKGFLAQGHDTYYSREMYANLMAARDAGVNTAFLSAGSMTHRVPLTPSTGGQPHRTMRTDGHFLDPELAQRYYETFPRGFKSPAGPDAKLLMGGHMAGIAHGDWTCINPDHWLFKGTGMKAGESIEDFVGWHYNGYPAIDLPGFQTLAKGRVVAKGKEMEIPYVATIYNGPKGNLVFNAATVWWNQGLSVPPGHVQPPAYGKDRAPEPRVQRMTENLLKRFLSSKKTIPDVQ